MRAVPLSRYLLFLAIAGAGLAIDLGTKHWMFAWLGPPGVRIHWVWEDVFGFETCLNPGALFGLGSHWPSMRYVTCSLSLVAAAAVVLWLFAFGAAKDRLLTVALGCVIAGILGNLYDRLGLPGLTEDGATVYKVRDWILVVIPVLRIHWPNFNVADSLLVCGACLVVWHAFIADDNQGSPDAGGPGGEGHTQDQ